jgi:hypothetical protein
LRKIRFYARRVEADEMGNEADREAASRAAERRSRMQIRVIGLKDDHDAFDREYFAGLSPGERMTLVGKMFAEQWLLMGGNEDELRLLRDIARVQRRGR